MNVSAAGAIAQRAKAATIAAASALTESPQQRAAAIGYRNGRLHGEDAERRLTPGRLPRSMIFSHAVSDDHMSLFLILGELSKQRFTLA